MKHSFSKHTLTGLAQVMGLIIALHLFFLLPGFPQSISLQQDLRFENFTYQKNVTPAFIGNTLVDNRGYLWVCSDALYRFDGVNATKYSSFENTNRGLKNNYCDDLLNDEFGRLWIGNLAGLCYYDSFKDSIIYLDAGPGKPITFAFSFIISNNILWFVCNYGLCQVDLKTLTVRTTSLSEVKNPTGTYHISQNSLGISSRNAFYIYDIERNSYIKKNFEVNKTSLRIKDIKEKGNEFWVATNAGLMTTKDFSDLEPVSWLPPLNINNLLFHPADKEQIYLWLATGGSGLYVANTETHQLQFHYSHQPLAPFSIPSNNIFKLKADKDENIWIGTEKGISLLQLKYQPFQTKFLSFENNSTDNLIGYAVQDKFNPQQVWLACQHQGLIVVNWDNKEIIQQHKSMAGAGGGLNISDMEQINEKKWLLLYSNSLLIWNKTGRVEKIATWIPPHSAPSSLQFNKLIKKNENEFYLTSTQGLFRYDLHTNELRQVLQRPEYSAVYSSLDLQGGFFDGHENLWLASRDGLVQYNSNNGKYHVYKNNSNDNHINFLNDVTGDKMGNIYCAGIGISRFDTVSKKFSTISIAGLIHPNSFALLLDSNALWANTNAGLLMMNLKTNENRRFIISGPAETYSFSRLTKVNNELLIGYRDAYAYLNLSLTKNNDLPTSPVIENVFVNNEFYNLGATDHSFRHWQNNIRVVFTAFDYTDASSIRFRYKLTGGEDKWNYTNNERSIQFARLQPGKYTLIIQAGNNEGWNETSKEFSFVIRSAFWQTWWFRIAALALIVSIIFTIIKTRIKNIRKQAGIRQLMAETEMKALRAQMNPHFIFNCMATADGLILQNKKMEASDFLHKFSNLVRMVLENSMHTMVSLQKDIEALQLYLVLEQIRHQHSFEYSIKIEENIDEISTCIPPLLLQPFVENAILHGLRHRNDHKGQLFISITKKEESIVCIIDDNGIGRRQAGIINQERKHNHQSLGLKVTEARVKSMELLYGNKQSVLVEDKANDSGTIVIITLPFFSNCF